MNWKTLLLLAVAIALVVSSIVLYTMDKPEQIRLPHFGVVVSVATINGTVYNFTFTSPTSPAEFVVFKGPPPAMISPPLYAQLWFVALIAGIAILGFLGFKKFKL